jgi:SAM-dependent methyltransferase
VQESIPIPPINMRQLVGPTDPADFDNADGSLLYPSLKPEAYASVFDFGCGCGRLARQLMQQSIRPKRYVGVDLHRGMIKWCHENLHSLDRNFEFHHQDVFNAGLNPGLEKPMTARFPVEDASFSLVIALSVFTHVNEAQTQFYLGEIARILQPGGYLLSTWFLFDKADFPMMQDFQNSLFINEADPSNAVIFDRDWVRSQAKAAGLTITAAAPPTIKGFQWHVEMRPAAAGLVEAEFPPDVAPRGLMRPPVVSESVANLGLD